MLAKRAAADFYYSRPKIIRLLLHRLSIALASEAEQP
mgnify:CR=1 FL=1